MSSSSAPAPAAYVPRSAVANWAVKPPVGGRETLGGTCLNVGLYPRQSACCIATHMLHERRTHFDDMGLKGKSRRSIWAARILQTLQGKNTHRHKQRRSVPFKKNRSTGSKGWATIPEAGKVQVGDEGWRPRGQENHHSPPRLEPAVPSPGRGRRDCRLNLHRAACSLNKVPKNCRDRREA